jgi:hypothetical protein
MIVENKIIVENKGINNFYLTHLIIGGFFCLYEIFCMTELS